MDLKIVIVALMGVASCVMGADVVSVGTVNGVIEGEVAGVTVAGVAVRVEREGADARLVTVPWFEFRAIEDGWEVPGEFEEMSRLAAIGYGRRARGDLTGAGEMYAKLAVGLVGSESVMAIEVFGGLLDEAIVRGDFYDAAVAMMALRGMSMAKMDGYDGRYRVHEGAAMVPSGSEHRLVEVAEAIEGLGGSGALIVRAFGVVNGLDSGSEDVVVLLDELDAQRGADVPFRQGLELYSKMLAAQKHPEPEARADARRWLESRSESKSGTWIDAWCRLALGASYIEESKDAEGSGMLSRGVVELVHVMVRFETSHAGLARAAREMAVDGLRAGGRFEEAAQLVKSFDTMTIGNE